MKDKPEIAAVVVIVIGIGLIAGLVVNEQRKPDKQSQVLGEKFTQSDLPAPVETGGIPTLPVTIPVQILPDATKIVRPETTPAATTTARPVARSTSGTTARTSGVEAFDITIRCPAEGVRSDGTKWHIDSFGAPHRLAAGQKDSYTFTYDASSERSASKRCSFRTTRVAAGSASPLRILLRCSGESTYTSTPPSPQTSAISKSWKPGQLTGGFTHSMTAPRQSQQSERTSCALDVVRV